MIKGNLKKQLKTIIMNTSNNNSNEDQYQSAEDVNKYETAKVNHSFTENAEPDYSNDLIIEEFDKDGFSNENLGQDDHIEQLDNTQFDKEFSAQNTGDEFENDKLGNDEMPDFDEESDSFEEDNQSQLSDDDRSYDDEDGTNPNQNL